jgi:hypothetical protein
MRPGQCEVVEDLGRARHFAVAALKARRLGNHELVLSGHPRRPRVARKRLRQYQRRMMASTGLRTNCAMKRSSTIA